jgi:hypothetical protein
MNIQQQLQRQRALFTTEWGRALQADKGGISEKLL